MRRVNDEVWIQTPKLDNTGDKNTPYKLSLDTETNFRFDFNSQACNFSIIRWEACQPSPSTNNFVEFEQKPHFSKIPSLLKCRSAVI